MTTSYQGQDNTEEAIEKLDENTKTEPDTAVSKQDDLKPGAETEVKEIVLSGSSPPGTTPTEEEEEDTPGCCTRYWLKWRPFWHALIWLLITA